MAITPQQREDRRLVIGSSDMPMVCGLAPKSWGDPLKVYLDKLGVLPEWSSDAMTLGTLMEPVIATLYEQQTGRKLIDPGETFRHPTISYLGANLDRIREDNTRIVEIKMVGGEFSSEWGVPGTDEVPPHVLCQCQHQMLVTGYRATDVAALFLNTRRLEIYTVNYSEDFCNLLLQIAADFWNRVLTRRPPEPDWASPLTAMLVSLLHKPDPSVSIQLPPIAALLVDEDSRLAATLDEAEKNRAEVRGRLTQMLGDAGVGVLEDGRRVVRSQHFRNGKPVTQMRIYKARKAGA